MDQARGEDQSRRRQFHLRLAGWILLYLALLIPWGAYNQWPASLLVPLAYAPLGFATAAGLIRRHHLPCTPPTPSSHWELLVAFLLLAIGVATGYMLLISIAWICVGVAWLRPTRPPVAWVEWYKLPFLCLFCLPVLADLAGGRHDWLGWLGGLSDSASTSDLALRDLRSKILIRLTVLALAWWVNGPAFWICLGLVPLAFLGSAQMIRFLPTTWHEPAAWAGPALGVLLLTLLARTRLLLVHPPPTLLQHLTRELQHRSHALWLAALVTLTQQQSLVEVWLAGGPLKLDLSGAALLLLTLLIMRLASPPTPVDFRSRVTLIASQLVLFAAEFTDLNPLRHAALGVFGVAAISWGRTWNWIMLGGGCLCWITTLPAGEAVLIMTGIAPNDAALLRLGAFLITLLMTAGSASHTLNHPVPPSPAQHDWQPEQRFVFILLALLLFFQTLSAFAPATPTAVDPAPTATRLAQAGFTVRTLPSTSPHEAHLRLERAGQTFHLLVRAVPPSPLETTSTESTLRLQGWHPGPRRLISHENGQGAALDLARPGHTARALYWFQHGPRTFVNHLRARRILWSSWNLNRRDLSFFLLQADTPLSTEDLLSVARSQQWWLPLR